MTDTPRPSNAEVFANAATCALDVLQQVESRTGRSTAAAIAVDYDSDFDPAYEVIIDLPHDPSAPTDQPAHQGVGGQIAGALHGLTNEAPFTPNEDNWTDSFPLPGDTPAEARIEPGTSERDGERRIQPKDDQTVRRLLGACGQAGVVVTELVVDPSVEPPYMTVRGYSPSPDAALTAIGDVLGPTIEPQTPDLRQRKGTLDDFEVDVAIALLPPIASTPTRPWTMG